MNKKDPDGLKKDTTPYRIQIVDDSHIMRKMISQFLKSESYKIVCESEDGEQAVKDYMDHKPDLVTMDINMPKMSGVDALKEIIKYDKDAIVLMVTSESQKDTVLDCISFGAKGYIVKPPNRRKVLDTVKESLK